MASLKYPYYTLATSMQRQDGGATTKSIAAINLPANPETAAGDLLIVSDLLLGLTMNGYNSTTLNTRQEVTT